MLNGKQLKPVEYTEFLGVYVDEKLSWKQHINYIKSKVSKSLGILSLCRKHFDKKTLVSLYYSFIYPLLIYSIEVWGSSCKTYLQCLWKLQKRCVRLISCSPYRAHKKRIFTQVGILSKLYDMKVLLFVYKFLNVKLPKVFENFFITNNLYHSYSTRHGNLFRYPEINTELRKNTLRCMAVHIFNHMYYNMDFFKEYGL